MIQLITGAKGTGKTKQIIDMANANVDTASGNIVFVTDTDKYMFTIRPQVRIVNANVLKKGEADITEDSLIGFVKGLLAGNHDIETLYIDGAHRILNTTVLSMKEFFAEMFNVAKSTDTKIVLTVSEEEQNLPEFMRRY